MRNFTELSPFFSVFGVGHSAYFGNRSFWKLSLLKPSLTSSEFEFLLVEALNTEAYVFSRSDSLDSNFLKKLQLPFFEHYWSENYIREDQRWTLWEKVNWFILLLYILLLFFVVLFTRSSVGIPDAGNDGKMSDGLTPSLPYANNASPSVQDKLYRKLLTTKRLQVVNLKHLKNELAWAKGK